MKNLGEINISSDIKVFSESILIYCQSFNGILDEQCWKILPSIKIFKKYQVKSEPKFAFISLLKRTRLVWSNS